MVRCLGHALTGFCTREDVVLYSGSSATTLLPGQDKLAPSSPLSEGSSFVVSCGVRLSEVGLETFCKPQVGGSIPLASSTTSADDSTLGVFQNQVPSRLISVHPPRYPFALLEWRDVPCDGYLDAEGTLRMLENLSEPLLLGDVRSSTMTCCKRMD